MKEKKITWQQKQGPKTGEPIAHAFPIAREIPSPVDDGRVISICDEGTRSLCGERVLSGRGWEVHWGTPSFDVQQCESCVKATAVDGEMIRQLMAGYRVSVPNEAALQVSLEALFNERGWKFERESKLCPHDRPDFLIGRLAVEVKVDEIDHRGCATAGPVRGT